MESIVKLERAQQMLAEAKSLDDILHVNDLAEAAVAYARAAKTDPNYCGFHLLQFEKTSPDDGKIYIDGYQVTIEQLIQFLKFEEIK